MEPSPKIKWNSFFSNERFEKFYQEIYKKLIEEIEVDTCPTSDEEDNPMRYSAKRTYEHSHKMQQNLAGPPISNKRPYKAFQVATPDEDFPMSAPVIKKDEISTRTIEAVTGEDIKPQNLAEPFTSTQRPDRAFEAATPDEDYPISTPVIIKVESLYEYTIEVVIGEDKKQNVARPSTSTQRPDRASEAETPDEDYPMSAPVKIKFEMSTRTSEAVIGEDKQQNFAGPSTSTQRRNEASFTPICSKQAFDVQQQAVNIKKCINILADQCEMLFAEEGTFVPSIDFNDTVVRFMKPNNFWRKMHIRPPRINSKFHFYLVVQDPLPATGATSNHLVGKSNVMVVVRQALLKKDGRSYIKNLARLTASQYNCDVCLNQEINSISWENSTANDPIACEVMFVENLPFNPFSRNGRKKSDEYWEKITTSFSATTSTPESPTEETETTSMDPYDYELQLPITDLKQLPTSAPLAEKMFFDAAIDNRHEDTQDFLLVSKCVYVIPRTTHKKSKKNGNDSQPNVESFTNESGYTVSDDFSEPEEDIKFQISDAPHTRDPLRRPVSEYGNNFAENQIVEIPIENYFVLTTSTDGEYDESNLRQLADVAHESSYCTTDLGL